MNFDMGSYSVYIWPAYGVSALVLAGVTLWTLAAWQRAKASLAGLEKRGPQPKDTATGS
jgi:heme exporter protein CcmD